MQSIDVVLRKEDLEPTDASDKIAVVLDIIFATSTIVTALHQGARSVLPAFDLADATRIAATRAAQTYVLSGEHNARLYEGYWPFNPLAMLDDHLVGKDLILTTTNGTVALCNAAQFKCVYVGALLNGRALVADLLSRFEHEAIVLVCAGSKGRFSLEDFLGAGYLVDLLLQTDGARQFEPSDSAQAAALLFKSSDPRRVLMNSRLGKLMTTRQMEQDVLHAATLDAYGVVPVFSEGRIVGV